MKDTQLNSMDNGRAFLPSISTKRDYRRVLLSYRIYKRLNPKEKAKYDLLSKDYLPLVGSLALYLRSKTHIPIQKVLFLKAQRDMVDVFDEASLKFVGYLPKDRFLKKAFLFQGFVPSENIKVRSHYTYIMANRKIENQLLVYPVRFSDNYKTMIKGKYKSYTEYFGGVGIPGITKIRYSNGN